MRKHLFNESFFEIIDNEKKAYWLGFICADGYINNRGNTVGITLDIKDKEHLLLFLKDLCSNSNKLSFRKAQYDKNHKFTEKVSLNLYSRKMHKDLCNLGLDNNKSYSLKEIDIPNDLKNHFIRGYFDGDGCVFEAYSKYGKNKEKKSYTAGFTFVGTFDFLTYINKNLPFQVKSLRFDKRSKSSYTLYICSKKRFLLTEEFLYKNSTISLERKINKCNIIKNKIKLSSETIAVKQVQI